jgi:hypothetical protein
LGYFFKLGVIFCMYTIGHRGVSLQCASQTRRVEKGRVPCLDGDAGICLPNSDGGKGAGPPLSGRGCGGPGIIQGLPKEPLECAVLF